jgi:hypothetical protein
MALSIGCCITIVMECKRVMEIPPGNETVRPSVSPSSRLTSLFRSHQRANPLLIHCASWPANQNCFYSREIASNTKKPTTWPALLRCREIIKLFGQIPRYRRRILSSLSKGSRARVTCLKIIRLTRHWCHANHQPYIVAAHAQ